jgi:hypothetical protein
MPTDPAPDDIKQIWQNQEREFPAMTLDDIRAKASAFDRRIRNRNLREYLGAAVVLPIFGWYIWILQGWITQLGCALIIVAIFYVMWRLRRRAALKASSADTTGAAVIDAYRSALVRQRDLQASVWRWYLLPMAPGLLLMTLGRYLQDHVPGRDPAVDHMIILLGTIVVTLIWVIVWLLNLFGVARLQKRIDELDRLRQG